VEKNIHIFLFYPYSIQFWRDVEGSLGLVHLWNGDNIESFLQQWLSRKELESLRVIPYLTIWGICLERNASLFEDSLLPTFKVSTHFLGLVPYHKGSQVYNILK
jgi:hypothetical protein